MPATTETSEGMTDVTFEELIDLENEHNAVDTEILRSHWMLSQPLFARRRALIPRIPHFWPLVLDEGPPELTTYIQPSDARFFAEYLMDFEVARFELEEEPRSFELRFEFAPNPNFEEVVLKKRFWWRTSADGWTGLVSEPVAIRWKDGADMTNGLTDAACKLWSRWKELGGVEKKKGFSVAKDDAAYTALKNKLDNKRHESDSNAQLHESDSSVHSFFTLFTFVSTYRYVSAAESEAAEKQEAEQRAARAAGKAVSEQEEQDEELDDSDVTVCPNGEWLANLLVEEVYTNAVKYFTSAHEQDSDAPSESDFEEDDDSDSAPSLVAVEDKHTSKRRADGEDANGKPAKSRRKE